VSKDTLNECGGVYVLKDESREKSKIFKVLFDSKFKVVIIRRRVFIITTSL
jgi:hypothetical protein